ncbi:MAG: ATP-binding domain-containing protein, partial [Flavobacteriaceae bacterium]
GFQFDLRGGVDIVRIQDGNELLEALSDAIHHQGIEETAFLVRSNKRANLYNKNIRQRILFLEAELAVGDHLMVVKNNYFWLDDNTVAGFIANGDTVVIQRIYGYKSLYGFQFAEVQVSLADYPGQAPFDTYVLLDTLQSETAALSSEEANRLYQEVQQDYAHITSKYKRLLKVKSNPYFNALQVKYSYAITCHKSQGGQWNTVFIEQPYLAEGTNLAYYRWLYTAVTRAKEKLFLVNFTEEFFID